MPRNTRGGLQSVAEPTDVEAGAATGDEGARTRFSLDGRVLSTDARAFERTRREARASGGKKAACRLPPRRPRASSETVPHAEVHVVVDLTVDLEVEFEYPVSDEDVRRFAEARFERNRDVLDVVGVTERDDVRRVERGQRDRRGAVAAQVVAQSPAESDREHVLVLDGHQCAVSARDRKSVV